MSNLEPSRDQIMMRLLLDVDGVLANFRKEFIRVSKCYWPEREFNIRDWTEFKPWLDVCAFPIHSKEEFDKVFKLVCWDRIPPSDEMLAVREVARAAKFVRVATARPQIANTEEATRDWLVKYKIPYDELVFASNGTKWEWAENMTHVIDDCDEVTDKIKRAFPEVIMIPIGRPYNLQKPFGVD